MGSGFSVSAKLCILKGEVVILIQVPPTGVNPRQGFPWHFETFKNVPGVNKMIRIQNLLTQINQLLARFLMFGKKFVGEHKPGP